MQHGSNFIVTATKFNGVFYECLAWQPEEKITLFRSKFAVKNHVQRGDL